MKAERLLHQRVWISKNELIEMKIWRVPCPVPPCNHEYKYSLVYIRDGQRIIGFDNERGKGDHCHLGDKEIRYDFTSTDNLIRDFLELLKEHQPHEPDIDHHN